MNKRDVIRTVLTHGRPEYVPWDLALSPSAMASLAERLGVRDAEELVGNHFVYLGSKLTQLTADSQGTLKDRFGVSWVYAPDSESYMVSQAPLEEPTLKGYSFPSADDPSLYDELQTQTVRYNDRFRIFAIGYTLFERAWTLRGMENLMMDLVLDPGFVHQMLDAITEVNIQQIRRAAAFDFDCVHFGDDWGSQRGLLISPAQWREFIRPRLKRLFDAVRERGLYISVHSCGDIQPVLDDLEDLGVDVVNPFQPEAMDVWALFRRYQGRLTFHGGLSSQQTLPFGTVEQVKDQTRRLLQAGREGGYVFASGHGVDYQVPVDNILALLEVLQSQPGSPGEMRYRRL